MGEIVAPPAAAAAVPPPRLWLIGHFVFDPAARTLSADGVVERISGKASAVLLQLAEQAGDVVSRDHLIAQVWNGNVYTGAHALTHTVSQLRRSLRRLPASPQAAAPDAADAESDGAIETISKSGYRLLWPARPRPRAMPATDPAPAPALDVPVPAPVPPSPTAPAGAGAPARGASERNRLPFLIGIACLLLLAAGGWLFARHPIAVDAGQRSLSALTTLEGVEEFPAYAPDGHALAYVWRRTGSEPRLRIVDPQRLQATPREFADPLNLMLRPVWVDHDHLAYLQAVHAERCRVILVDLRDGGRRDLAGCFYERGAASLAASPDGTSLAFTQPSEAAPGGSSLVLFRIADGQLRELAQAPRGLGYGEIAWSHDGRHLAALQLKATVGDILRLDVQSGRTVRLTREASPIWALTWSLDDRELIFPAGMAGDFALWRIPADGGAPSRYARIDNVTSLVAIPDRSGDVAASVVRYDDRIELYALADGALRETIRSAGRDLYADACRDAEHPVFVSFRARRIGIWYRDGSEAEARELPLPPGTPEPPACSPDGRRYATVLSPSDGGANRLVIGAIDGSTPPTAIPLRGNVTNPSWSLDGASLIVSSDRSGEAELWRLDPETRTFSALSDDHGRFGREVVAAGQRWLYYSRDGMRGLWRRRLDDAGRLVGIAEAVVDDLAPQDWGNWAWHDGQLWRISRGPSGDRLLRRDAAGADHVALTLPVDSVAPFRSLSIDAAGRALVTRHGPTQADLVRIPDSP